MTSKISLTFAHARSRQHRAAIQHSGYCACFHCLTYFVPAEITEWVDDGETALCPKCGIDAVLYEAPDMPLTSDFLERMKHRWF